jgi:basic endochitinase B
VRKTIDLMTTGAHVKLNRSDLPFLILFSTLFFPNTNFCQATTPLHDRLAGVTVSKNPMAYLDEGSWNILFPHRYGYRPDDSLGHMTDFYTFRSFVKAAAIFPGFLSEGDSQTQKRELAAFLASIAYETGGGWSDAPGGYFAWGLYYIEERPRAGLRFNYTDSISKRYPPVGGQSYHGRGPVQLSWNYNYGKFSEVWFGTKDSLLANPSALAQDPVLAFVSAIWFWMTPQFPKPSCHDIMVGKWVGDSQDSLKGRLPGFGAVVNVINGGVSCGNSLEEVKTTYRYRYYQFFCNYFQVPPGENISCTTQIPFGQ